jgi:hypothetical protein
MKIKITEISEFDAFSGLEEEMVGTVGTVEFVTVTFPGWYGFYLKTETGVSLCFYAVRYEELSDE